MEVVTCYCLKCKAEVGRFRNSWIGIGNTYFSPVHPPLSLNGVEETGDVHQAAKGSRIEDSLLKDLACRKCQAVLGLQCQSAPENHFLKSEQLILRLAEMSVISEGSGGKAKISILLTFSLTHANASAMSPSSRRASTAQAYPISRSPSVRPGVAKTPSSNSRVSFPPKPLMSPPLDISEFKIWVENAINMQQQDISRISKSVERMEREMKLFKDFMVETSLGLSSTQISRTEGGPGVSNLSGKSNLLSRKPQETKKRPVGRPRKAVSMVEISQNIQQTGDSNVDDIAQLKLNLERIRARLQILEDSTTANTLPTALGNQNLVSPISNQNLHLKRNHSQMEVHERGSDKDNSTLRGGTTKKRNISNSSANAKVAGSPQKRASDTELMEIFTPGLSSSRPIFHPGNSDYSLDDVDDLAGPSDTFATEAPSTTLPTLKRISQSRSIFETTEAVNPSETKSLQATLSLEPEESEQRPIEDDNTTVPEAVGHSLRSQKTKKEKGSLMSVSSSQGPGYGHASKADIKGRQSVSRSSLSVVLVSGRSSSEVIEEELAGGSASVKFSNTESMNLPQLHVDSDGFAVPPLPSIERDQPRSTPRLSSTFSGVSSPHSLGRVQCDFCGKGYPGHASLVNHQRYSECSNAGQAKNLKFQAGQSLKGKGQNNVDLGVTNADHVARDTKLAERERRVRETLERELSEAV